jgi:hypothetical protein
LEIRKKNATNLGNVIDILACDKSEGNYAEPVNASDIFLFLL